MERIRREIMRTSERFHLNLIDETDPVLIANITNNFSTLDSAIARRITEIEVEIPNNWDMEQKTITVAVEGVQEETKGFLVMDFPKTDEEERRAITYAKIFVQSQNAGSITFQCDGTLPTMTIHVKIINLGVD